jgi:hypothetical protein
MKRSAFFCAGLVLAALASGPAMAQERGGVGMPHFGFRGINPGMSLSAPATTPLQSQMQNDYATQLQSQQRDLLQQNSSGLSRPEISIGHALNGFTPR